MKVVKIHFLIGAFCMMNLNGSTKAATTLKIALSPLSAVTYFTGI